MQDWLGRRTNKDDARGSDIGWERRMEELMEVGSVSKPAYAARHLELRAKPSASKRMAAVAEPRLTTRVSLMLALLLSLGLWAAIWALASAIGALVSF